MPSKSRTDEIQSWRTRLGQAEAQLKPQKKRWERTLRQYRGIFHPELVDEEDRRDGVNHALSILSRTIPRLYYRDPSIIPRPKHNDPVIIQGTKAIRAYLEQEIERLRFGRETRKVLLDAFIYSEGYAKVGYQAVFEESGDKAEQIGAALPAFPAEGGLAARADLLKLGKLSGEDVAFDDRLKSEELFIMRVHPGHMLHDPGAKEIEYAGWMAHIIPRRIEEVKAVSSYNKSVTSMIAPHASTEDVWLATDDVDTPTGSGDAQIMDDSEEGWTKVIEIWDRVTGMVYVMTPDSDDYLRPPRKWPYKPRGFPFKRLQFNMDPESWWSQPDLEAWLPMIEDLNFYRKKRRHRIRKNISKLVVDSTAVDEEGKDALKSDIEQDLVLVNAQDAKPRDVAMRLDPAGSPPDIGIAEAREKEDLNNVSGSTSQRRGSQGTYTTATEASIIEVAAQENEADRLSTVREFQQEVVSYMLGLARQFQTIPQVVGTSGPQGFLWYDVGEKIINHPYDVEIQVGSSRYVPESEQLAGEQMFFGLMAQTGFAFGDPVQSLRNIAYLLRISDVDSRVPDPSDPEGLKRMAFLQMYRQVMGIQPAADAMTASTNGAGAALGAVTDGGIAGAPNAMGNVDELAAAAQGGTLQ